MIRLRRSSGLFFEDHEVKVLNVAGPRASTAPKVGQFVMSLLDEVLGVPD
jgi:Circularly permutated YpsA SLOG family